MAPEAMLLWLARSRVVSAARAGPFRLSGPPLRTA